MNIKTCFLLLTLFLASCGFHIRGLVELPKWFNHVAVVSSDNHYELTSILKSRLDSYHIELSNNPAIADFVIIIQQSLYQIKIISIGASTNPRQYQMILTTNWHVQNRKGKIIIPQTTATVTRQLTVNNDRILGSNDEEMTLQREMRQDTVTQIMNKLSQKLT